MFGIPYFFFLSMCLACLHWSKSWAMYFLSFSLALSLFWDFWGKSWTMDLEKYTFEQILGQVLESLLLHKSWARYLGNSFLVKVLGHAFGKQVLGHVLGAFYLKLSVEPSTKMNSWPNFKPCRIVCAYAMHVFLKW